MFSSDTFQEFSNSFLFWYNANANSSITGNTAVFFANIAQKRIWQYEIWDYLLKDVTLTVNSAREADLPSDFGKDVAVYEDNNGDGRPDSFLYLNGNQSRGYKVVGDFNQTDGYTNKKFIFFNPPSAAVLLKYQPFLINFDQNDANLNTKILAFPLRLMVLTAQVEAMIQMGPITDQYQVLRAEYENEMRDFQDSYQHNNGWVEMAITDRFGNQVFVDDYNLSGGTQSSSNVGRRNSFLP
jgi:hypothetical protein